MCGRVDEVGDQDSGEDPVVGGVFEDVEGGHGGIAEAVHQEGLDFAFEKVEGDESYGESL